jgi:hypothetical protein
MPGSSVIVGASVLRRSVIESYMNGLGHLRNTRGSKTDSREEPWIAAFDPARQSGRRLLSSTDPAHWFCQRAKEAPNGQYRLPLRQFGRGQVRQDRRYLWAIVFEFDAAAFIQRAHEFVEALDADVGGEWSGELARDALNGRIGPMRLRLAHEVPHA